MSPLAFEHLSVPVVAKIKQRILEVEALLVLLWSLPSFLQVSFQICYGNNIL